MEGNGVTKIVLSSAWTQGGRTEFASESGSLTDVIKGFAAAHPQYRYRLLDHDGEPFGYFNVFVDDQLVRASERSGAVVSPGSTVTIVPPLAGG
ncbi:MoaD/ThiS family protein [Haloechinothrix salitolerans]|uniref:MoaD/ThiS family protein n=1 Tax=Haloechinothrix salitolerans TaxID=926830 RepID=A0ABW2BW19_9PSEU